MSFAYKCDRCGKFYQRSQKVKAGDPYVGFNIANRETGSVDLCDGCTDSLKKWMENKEEDE